MVLMGTEKPKICSVLVVPSVERNAEMIIGAAHSNKNAMSVKSANLVPVRVIFISFWVLDYINEFVETECREADYHID